MTGRQYTVTEIGVEEDRVNVSIRFNGYIFSIGMSADCFVNSPVALERFRRFLRGLTASIRTDSQAQEENDYCDDVANVFRPDFERLAPPKVHTGKVTLADIAARGHFKCDYQVIDEKDVPGAVTARENDWPGGREGFDIREFRSLFPLFDPAEVEVELPGSGMDDIHNIIPQKIFVDGKAGFYKKCDRPYACREEVEKYYAIQASGLSTQQLRTSRLFGIVADRNGRMSGLLYDLIQTKAEGVQGTLDAAATPATPMPLREKWASQIRNTVTDLHDLGVAWGDVKADNVLIDADDNAVVIDLEGGSTDKWVDRSMGGTVAGDLQGLEKLVDFILNDNCPLRRVTGREEEEYDGREHLVLSQGVPIS